jgi:hypothetical protein
MENFFNYMTQTVPKEDLILWLNIHNMYYERIELFGDIFKTLYFIISDTYLGNEDNETKIIISQKDNDNHFNWCWEKLIDGFLKEDILIEEYGDHKDYFKSFFDDSFYGVNKSQLRLSIPNFLDDIFNMDKEFVKPDLDILTEYYKILQKHVN